MLPGRRWTHLCAAFATLLALAPGARAAATLEARIPPDSATVMSMADRGSLDSAHAVVRPLVAEARRLGATAMMARTQLLEAAIEIRRGHAAPVYDSVLAAVKLAEASRDTSTWMWGMRLQSMAENYLGRRDAAERLARRWNELAERTGNIEYQAWARTMFGWLAWQRGDAAEARRNLEWSVERFDGLGNPIGLGYSLNVLGDILLAEGAYERARECYERGLEIGTREGNIKLQVYVLQNLGAIEGRIGDPALAIRHYRRTIELTRASMDLDAQLIGMSNLGELALEIGRFDEARRIAEEAIALSREHQMPLELPWHEQELAAALWAAGRGAEAKAAWRRVWDAGDAVELEPRLHSALGLGEGLASEDSVAAAREILDAALARSRRDGDRDLNARLVLARNRLRIGSGEFAAALGSARALAEELENRGQLELGLAAWTQVAQAARRLGRADEARAALGAGTAAWERGRTRVTDLEYRELRGEQAHLLMMERVAAALGSGGDPAARARDGFEGLQPFKTRTLLERVTGPRAWSAEASGWLEAPSVPLSRFQREVLRQGELFLEFAFGPDTTWMFAVTRDSCRAVGLAGEARLGDALDLARSTFSAPPRGSGDTGEAMARRLGSLLLAGIGDLLDSSRAVIIAADGPLHRVPFAALAPPGTNAPLCATRPVFLTPSASLLEHLRTRPSVAPGRGVLALLGGPGGRGRPLPGAEDEVRAIGRRFDGVRLRRLDAVGGVIDARALRGWGVLHFAAHGHLDDQVPWRSGVVLGVAADGSDSLLTAAEIAGDTLTAGLVVLSSCESAGGRARSAEGVAGLGSAFLAAGAPVVVATLWPVDDVTTAKWMEAFYKRLATGAKVGEALRGAQEALRANPETAAPFYWAGFVALGDGERIVPLPRRRRSLPLPVGLAVLVTLGIVGLAIARSQKRPAIG